MTPLVTFIIPSRGRPKGLHKAIDSILITATDPEGIEIVCGFDAGANDICPEGYGKNVNIRCKTFYKNETVPEICEIIAKEAKGQWCCVFNDDAEIWGMGWDEQLALIPTTGYIVQPETYRLDLSDYRGNFRTGFPFWPSRCWEQFNLPFIPHPLDHCVSDVAQSHGWSTKWLQGITIFHDRQRAKDYPEK